ncbi:aminodeoxychorismate lyase [Salinisphaera sp. T31B1]|uniref:aminodeoxychorismate lyase n=1 Tax=Salinisphaera sp. T31B1 TaxID=727963 RepID=UPI003341BBE1
MADSMIIDGERADRVPGDDRGLAYGDGVFRTLRVDHGNIQAWAVHIQRLAHDCARLSLPAPDTQRLRGESEALFANGRSGVLKIMITRGSGGRGYTPPAGSVRRIVSAHPLPESVPGTLVLERSPVILAEQPRLAGVKHLNRLEQVLARQECEHAGVSDAFMCDSAGRIVSTTMRNLVFLQTDGEWVTPALARAGIIGATRQRLMTALGSAGTRVHERDVNLADLGRYCAAVACNSVSGPIPVERLGGQRFESSDSAREYLQALMKDND